MVRKLRFPPGSSLSVENTKLTSSTTLTCSGTAPSCMAETGSIQISWALCLLLTCSMRSTTPAIDYLHHTITNLILLSSLRPQQALSHHQLTTALFCRKIILLFRPFPIPVLVTDRHHYPAIIGKGRDNSLLIINHVQYSLFNHHGPCSPSLLWRGVKLGNLRPLSRAALLAVRLEPPAPARFGLVNARSIGNKSFILKDFFQSRELDFLFISKTWLSVGESSAFTELVLDGCF